MLLVGDIAAESLQSVLKKYELQLVFCGDGEPIKGSFWGEPEAGVIRDTVYVRADTPVHSLLHETCHVICMSPERRRALERDAGGDDLEESAVCFLQILLADSIGGAGSERVMLDMDAWGYSFRLGSTAAWFANDGEDARQYLLDHKLISEDGMPTFRLRS